MKLGRFHWIALMTLLVGILIATGCGDDEMPTSTGMSTAEELCNRDVCLTNPTVRANCIQEVNVCIQLNPPAPGQTVDENCQIIAEASCGVERVGARQ